jgi:hypothetical protein
MVNVNKYIKNVGKSVLYTTADVMKEKFDYITDFKSTNSDLMKDTYNAIKVKDSPQTGEDLDLLAASKWNIEGRIR